MASQLNDKVAIVTGSNSGLGEAIAIMFASRGASVTLCGRDSDRLKSVFEKVVKVSGGHQEKHLSIQGDLNDQKVRKEVVDQTVKKFGRLDILVANAGLSDSKTNLMNATEQSYDVVMDTNVKSVFFLIQQAVPLLEITKGSITIVSSVASTLVSSNTLVYPMSKAAIDHLTRCLAVDLGQKGIRVNSVNPSFIPTRILRFAPGDYEKATEQRVDFENSKLALKGRPGQAEDVAAAVTFLASNSAGFITGQHIKVDGGRSFGEPNGWSVPTGSH